MVSSLLPTTAPAYGGQNDKKKPVTSITKDQFQFTLSSEPYTADASAAFVRNACELGKKHKKPNS